MSGSIVGEGRVGETLPVKGTGSSRVVTEDDVVSGGEIIGSDPSEQVRLDILRNAQSPAGGGGDGG